jgi:UDP-N-acetyl-D-glucosamine dehydrogenase
VDPTYLAWKMRSLNFTARFIETATEINTHMPEHVAKKVADLLNEERIAVNGAQVLILGVSYKPDVSDIRESPALDIIALLEAKGAEVRYHDPHVPEVRLGSRTAKSVDLTDEAIGAADVVVIVTNHSSVDYESLVARAHRVYDTRNATRNVTQGKEKVRKL